VTTYELNRFTIDDARALVGRVCDITEWDPNDDDFGTKIVYPAARVLGIITGIGPYLLIATTGAVMTDAATGEHLATRPAKAERCVDFTWMSEATNIRDGQSGG
jgi:hypothetical protein